MNGPDKTLLSGKYLLSGAEACVEGAFIAGCRFLAGYPIVPALNIYHHYLKRARDLGATYVQMEDEISALAAVLGASWTGKKSMTATAGPGFSLMMEHFGLGVMLETPCVIVDVQHIGPGLGMPTAPFQGDIMQSRWGSHGDYETIVLVPSSAQEMFNFTIKAFNFSEHYRVPVVVLSDAYLADEKEEVIVPELEKIEIESRRYYDGPKEKYLPYKREADFVPLMVDTGKGYKFHVTGLTHDERGYPVMNEECQEFNVHPLVWKIRKNADKIINFTEVKTDDADVIVITYGFGYRTCLRVVEQLRAEGIKVGLLKLNIIWPFPEKRIYEIVKKVKGIVVMEMNCGQVVFEVERIARGATNVLFTHQSINETETSQNLISAINHALKINGIKDKIIGLNDLMSAGE